MFTKTFHDGRGYAQFQEIALEIKALAITNTPPPPPRPPKNNVEVTEVWLDSFWSRLNKIDHGGARGEAKAVTNSRKRY